MTEESTYKEVDFPAQYISLRKKEGRIYSDDEVAQLPEIDKEHRYYFEWLIRKSSCNQLIKYLANKKRPLHILEVGCGNGWLSAKLSSIPSSRVTGIDINDEELNQAKRIFSQISNLDFFSTTLESEFLATMQFDIVVFAASIQYYKSLKTALADAAIRLRSNGEIHILDSHFYREGEINSARQRSRDYFESIGFPEMADQYFHHSLGEVSQFDHTILHDPHSLFNKFKKNKNPFYWIFIKANA